MQVVINFAWTKKTIHVFDLNEVQAKELLKNMNNYNRLLPKGYRRSKRVREYCNNIDKKIQKLVKNKKFYFSDYIGRQYIKVILNG